MENVAVIHGGLEESISFPLIPLANPAYCCITFCMYRTCLSSFFAIVYAIIVVFYVHACMLVKKSRQASNLEPRSHGIQCIAHQMLENEERYLRLSCDVFV